MPKCLVLLQAVLGEDVLCDLRRFLNQWGEDLASRILNLHGRTAIGHDGTAMVGHNLRSLKVPQVPALVRAWRLFLTAPGPACRGG